MAKEEILEKVKKLKPIDDVFFERLMENKLVCQEILRVILDDDKLVVQSVVAQREVKNLYGRSVRLDALCILGNGEICNIEVQKSDNDDHIKRVRYNASLITANSVPNGSKFSEIPTLIMVYISRFDIFKKNRNIYHAHTTLTDEGLKNMIVDNGITEVYVNTAVKNGTTLSELMECFEKEKVDNKKFPCLSREVNYYKTVEKGIKTMCSVVEEYAQEKAASVMVHCIENLMETCNMTLQQACSALKINEKDYEAAKKLVSEELVSA